MDINRYEATALLFGCSENTVRKIHAEKNKNTQDMRQYRFISDDLVSDEEIIPLVVNFIQDNLAKGRRVTSEDIIHELKQRGTELNKRTLIRKMKRWGFSWGKLVERDIRRETAENLLKRDAYLQNLLTLEAKGYNLRVYIDESYVNQNHSFNEGWYISPEIRRIYKKSGLGRRIAIVGAITRDGWLGKGQKFTEDKLKMKSQQGTHEYESIAYWDIQEKKRSQKKSSKVEQKSPSQSQQSNFSDQSQPNSPRGNFETDTFVKYFRNNVLNHISAKRKAIIILDNASYHTTFNFQINGKTRKKDIIDFLNKEGVEVDERMSLEYLRQLVIKQRRTKVEEAAEKYGHRVLFLPPYHPELNPIEYIWATIKRTVARHAPYDVKVILTEVLPMAFSAVVQTDFRRVFDHVSQLEQGYRNLGSKETLLIEEEVKEITQKLIKNVQSIKEIKLDAKHLRKRSYGTSKSKDTEKETEAHENIEKSESPSEKTSKRKTVIMTKQSLKSKRVVEGSVETITSSIRSSPNGLLGRRTIPSVDKLYSTPTRAYTSSNRNTLKTNNNDKKVKQYFGFPRIDQNNKVDNSCFIISAVIGISSLPYFHKGIFLESLNTKGPWNWLASAALLPFHNQTFTKKQYEDGLLGFYSLKEAVNVHCNKLEMEQNQFSGKFQQPCGNWILHLFDFFETEYKKSHRIANIRYESNDAEGLNQYLHSGACVFSAFQSMLVQRTQILCKNCKTLSHTHIHYSPYIVVDLEPEIDYINEQTIMKVFLNTETINYRCTHKGKKVKESQGTKTTRLFYYGSMPRFLILDMNRGIEQMIQENNRISDQIKKDGGFFLKLQRHEHSDVETKKYNITAISKHYGGADFGHWMTYVLVKRDELIVYFQFDDDRVSEVTQHEWENVLDNAHIIYLTLENI